MGSSGYFLYGNHTQYLDAFLPAMAAFPKRSYVIANPDAVSIPGLRNLVQLIGCIPVPSELSGLPAFWRQWGAGFIRSLHRYLSGSAHLALLHRRTSLFRDLLSVPGEMECPCGGHGSHLPQTAGAVPLGQTSRYDGDLQSAHIPGSHPAPEGRSRGAPPSGLPFYVSGHSSARQCGVHPLRALSLRSRIRKRRLFVKTLYLIGGTMGIGKTTACRLLKTKLPDSVFLDGDWCWDMHPFQVNPETKQMVLDNICCLLNNFLRCSCLRHIIFCWVMDQQSILTKFCPVWTQPGGRFYPSVWSAAGKLYASGCSRMCPGKTVGRHFHPKSGAPAPVRRSSNPQAGRVESDPSGDCRPSGRHVCSAGGDIVSCRSPYRLQI